VIKFEVGKYYRMENGGKVRVVATDGIEPTPIIGIAENRFNGNWQIDGGHTHQDNRIISEWIDKPSPPWAEVPKWFNWFAADSNGRQFYYPQKPTTSGYYAWLSISLEPIEIPIPHRIPVTCNWKDSLVERPTV